MTRSPDSLVPSAVEQSAVEKRDDKVFDCRQEDEANLRAATQVNVVSASSIPPAITSAQLDLFPGRACPFEAKPATGRKLAGVHPVRRDGVQDGGTQRKHIRFTGETLSGPAKSTSTGREAYKGKPRKRRNKARQGVGDGRSTNEARENRVEGRAVTFIKRTKQGKAAGLRPRGKAQPRTNRAKRKAPARLDKARKLRRTLYRAAKQQPERRFTLLYDKVCRRDILQEAWKRVKSNGGAAGVDRQSVADVTEYGEEQLLSEIEQELRQNRYRASEVRRVHIPKPGQPGKTRPVRNTDGEGPGGADGGEIGDRTVSQIQSDGQTFLHVWILLLFRYSRQQFMLAQFLGALLLLLQLAGIDILFHRLVLLCFAPSSA